MLLEHLVAEFEFHCKARELSRNTIINYMRQISYLQKFVKDEHNVVMLEDVKPMHIKQFLVMKQQAGAKPAYINDLLKAFKCMFRYAWEEGYTETLITEKIKNVKQPKVLIRSFSKKEIRDMIAYYNRNNYLDMRNRVILMMFFDTGIRLNELTSLQLEQVKDGYLLIHGKGNKERVVPKSPLLAKWLFKYFAMRTSYFEYKSVPDYVFLSKTGKRMNAEATNALIRKASVAVGVDPSVRASPHTCRHTFAHMQLQNGLDLYSLSRLMGHENIAITQRYLDGIRNDEVLIAAKKTGVLANL
ncbi:tyrosine-type recombinase/integrase [Eubacteriales bacterium OttesenSCG-928-A19]|nr:tyrosine-type recombinase/integrase [Eubacteriales bacterium OttesenSCG-928-A19]